MSESAPAPRISLVRAILLGGLLAGVGDLAFAFAYYHFRNGATPGGILQSIATGLLGIKAFEGGSATMALGLVLHFAIATGAAAVFCIAAQYWPDLRRRVFLSGPLFGMGVYMVMNAIVLPLSAYPFPIRFSPVPLLAHMFLVGLPIAHVACRYER